MKLYNCYGSRDTLDQERHISTLQSRTDDNEPRENANALTSVVMAGWAQVLSRNGQGLEVSPSKNKYVSAS